MELNEIVDKLADIKRQQEALNCQEEMNRELLVNELKKLGKGSCETEKAKATMTFSKKYTYSDKVDGIKKELEERQQLEKQTGEAVCEENLSLRVTLK